MKLDTASKRVIWHGLTVLAIIGIWATIDLLLIDRFFDTTLWTALFEQPNYFYGLIWLMFTFLSSKFEALFWHQCKEYPPYNPHTLFMWVRASVLIPIFFHVGLLPVLCYIMAFPCLHDGIYYWQRNKLNPSIYPKKFLDQSTTSTARWTKYFTPVVRTLLAISGVACLISIQIYNG